MKKVAVLVASVVAMVGLAVVPIVTPPVYADCSGVPSKEQAGCAACEAGGDTWTTGTGCDNANSGDLNDIIHTVINVMLFIVGILAVVMIIFSGIRYVTSAGDKGRVDSAKNTIIYSVVGLIVAIVAFALVQWVFNSIT
jgi:hypothetical protein